MNHFKFHPVGQGLFYTGQLAGGKYNFVYDCGSLSRDLYLKDSIEEYVLSLKTNGSDVSAIDFAVISHLHADHFNGLMYLMDKIYIRKIILPYIGDDINFIALILANAIFTDVNNEQKEHSFALFDFMLGLYERNGNIEDHIKFDREEISRKGMYCFVKQIKMVNVENTFWSFVFLNRIIPQDQLNNLISKMHRAMIDFGVTSICDLVHNHGFDVIKKIYNSVFATNHNISSTILLHYPTEYDTFNETSISFTNIKCNIITTNINLHEFTSTVSLLTGDAMITDDFGNEIKNSYPNDIGEIGVLQMPHHGSLQNYQFMKRQRICAEAYVVSYGLGNRYKHPRHEVIDDLYENNKSVFFANQYEFFDYIIE